MNNLIYLFLPSLLLIGCATSKNTGGSDFYTLVDSSGRMVTVKKTQASSTKAEVESTNTNESPVAPGFDPSDFIPSDEVDKKIKGGRLYAWQENNRQEVVEDIPGVEYSPSTQKKFKPKPFVSKSFKEYREGEEIFLSEHIGRIIDLERFYLFNKKTQSDYVLFELDVQYSDFFSLASFVQKGKVVLPSVVFLDAEYRSVSAIELPFREFSEESWSSYAKLYGEVFRPKNAKYLLLTPTKEVGVVEIGDKIIKMTNLGKILIK